MRLRSHLARLAASAAACAVVAAPAHAQDQYHHDRDRGGGGGDGRGSAEYRSGHRQAPRGPGWDERRYNGYWVGPRWHYGAPQGPAYQAPGFRPDFVPFRRGGFLPPEYQGYVLQDYWRFRLRRPPYGYEWVQVGDEFLLVSATTGLIFDVIIGG
jgi:Ni/Co efflux regulator RcnB